MRFALVVVVFTFILHNSLLGQGSSTGFERVVTFPSRFLQNLNNSANKYEQQLSDNTEKFLKRLQRQEARLKNELRRNDSLSVSAVFSNTDSIYNNLIRQVQQRNYATDPKNDQYVAFLDTLRTSLRFLEENPNGLHFLNQD